MYPPRSVLRQQQEKEAIKRCNVPTKTRTPTFTKTLSYTYMPGWGQNGATTTDPFIPSYAANTQPIGPKKVRRQALPYRRNIEKRFCKDPNGYSRSHIYKTKTNMPATQILWSCRHIRISSIEGSTRMPKGNSRVSRRKQPNARRKQSNNVAITRTSASATTILRFIDQSPFKL